jgi:hypothetical protein
MKLIAAAAIESSKTSPLYFGLVKTVNPLSITLDNVGVITREQLTVIRPVQVKGTVKQDVAVRSTGTNTLTGSSSGSGSATLSGSNSMSGNNTYNGNQLSVQPQGDTAQYARGTISVSVTGNTSVSGTVNVSGSASVNGNVAVNGTAAVNTTVTSTELPLVVGDYVALIRHPGGNKFLILGVVQGA